jgi:hemin uptake protein HemP
MSGSSQPPSASKSAGLMPKQQTPAVIDTTEMFAGGTEVRVLHRGQEYRLRITRQGKLILTK